MIEVALLFLVRALLVVAFSLVVLILAGFALAVCAGGATACVLELYRAAARGGRRLRHAFARAATRGTSPTASS